MLVHHLPCTAGADEAAASIRQHGYVIVDELVPQATMDRLEAELDPYLEKSAYGAIPGFDGPHTRRTGSLIARSPLVRELVMNDLVLGVVKKVLAHAQLVQLSLTEVIALSPGAHAQYIHRDELLFDAYPFDNSYEVYCNSLWAMTDYTEEMGATRIVPGSHRLESDLQFTPEDTVAAEMPRGSALLYSGKLYHGAGENKSDRVRKALDLGYAVGWVRQEENQYLACPIEIARTLPEDLLRLMGYAGAHGYGGIGDRSDPLTAIKASNE